MGTTLVWVRVLPEMEAAVLVTPSRSGSRSTPVLETLIVAVVMMQLVSADASAVVKSSNTSAQLQRRGMKNGRVSWRFLQRESEGRAIHFTSYLAAAQALS